MVFSKDELRRLEELLLKDRGRTVRKLSRFAEEFVDTAGDGAWMERNIFTLHAAEPGTDMMEREKAFLLASEEGRRLAAIDAALRKLYREPEAFGRCERCGGEIGLAGLEALRLTAWWSWWRTLQEAGGAWAGGCGEPARRGSDGAVVGREQGRAVPAGRGGGAGCGHRHEAGGATVAAPLAAGAADRRLRAADVHLQPGRGVRHPPRPVLARGLPGAVRRRARGAGRDVLGDAGPRQGA